MLALLIWCCSLPSLVGALRCFKSSAIPTVEPWRQSLLPLIPALKLAVTEHYVERFMAELIAIMAEDFLHVPVEEVFTTSLRDPYQELADGVYDIHYTSTLAQIDAQFGAQKFRDATSKIYGYTTDASEAVLAYREALYIHPRSIARNDPRFQHWAAWLFLTDEFTAPFPGIAGLHPDPAACKAIGRGRDWCVDGIFTPPYCPNGTGSYPESPFVPFGHVLPYNNCAVAYKDYPGTGSSAFEHAIANFLLPIVVHYIGDKLYNLTGLADGMPFLAYGYVPSVLDYTETIQLPQGTDIPTTVELSSFVDTCGKCYMSNAQVEEYGGPSSPSLVHCGNLPDENPTQVTELLPCPPAAVGWRQLYHTQRLESQWPSLGLILQLGVLSFELISQYVTGDFPPHPRMNDTLLDQRDASIEQRHACRVLANEIDSLIVWLEERHCTLAIQPAAAIGSVQATQMGGFRCMCLPGELFTSDSSCQPCPPGGICPGRDDASAVPLPPQLYTADTVVPGPAVKDSAFFPCGANSRIQGRESIEIIEVLNNISQYIIGPAVLTQCACNPGFTWQDTVFDAIEDGNLNISLGECTPCPGGYYKANFGVNACPNRCPPSTGSLGGATELNNCKCLGRSYLYRASEDNLECRFCSEVDGGDEGANCVTLVDGITNYTEVLESEGWLSNPDFMWNDHALPRSLPGWFMSVSGSPDADTGLFVAFWRCRARDACKADNTCHEGMAGFGCSKCLDGYGRGLANTVCIKCDQMLAVITGLVLLIIMVAMSILMTLETHRCADEEDSLLGILVLVMLQHNYVGGYVILLRNCPSFLKSINFVARTRLSFSCLVDLFGVKTSYEIAAFLVIALIAAVPFCMLVAWTIRFCLWQKHRADIALTQFIVDDIEDAIAWLATYEPPEARRDRKDAIIFDLRRMQDLEVKRNRVWWIWRTVLHPGEHRALAFLEDCLPQIFFLLYLIYQISIPLVAAELVSEEKPLQEEEIYVSTELSQIFMGNDHRPWGIGLAVYLLVFGGGFFAASIYIVRQYSLLTFNVAAQRRFGVFWLGAKIQFPQRYYIPYLMAEAAMVGLAREGIVFSGETADSVSMVLALTGCLVHASIKPLDESAGEMLQLIADLVLASWCLSVVTLQLYEDSDLPEDAIEVLEWFCIGLNIIVYVIALIEALVVLRARTTWMVETHLCRTRFLKGQADHPAVRHAVKEAQRAAREQQELANQRMGILPDPTAVKQPEEEAVDVFDFYREEEGRSFFAATFLWMAHIIHVRQRQRQTRLTITSRSLSKLKEVVQAKTLNEVRVLNPGRRKKAAPKMRPKTSSKHKGLRTKKQDKNKEGTKDKEDDSGGARLGATDGLVPAGQDATNKFISALVDLLVMYMVLHSSDAIPYLILEFLLYDAIDFIHYRVYSLPHLLTEITRSAMMTPMEQGTRKEKQGRYAGLVKAIAGSDPHFTPTIVLRLERLLDLEEKLGTATLQGEVPGGDLTLTDLHRYSLHMRRSSPKELAWVLNKFTAAVEEKRKRSKEARESKAKTMVAVAAQTKLTQSVEVQTVSYAEAGTLCTREMIRSENGMVQGDHEGGGVGTITDWKLACDLMEEQIVANRQESICAERESLLLRAEVEKLIFGKGSENLLIGSTSIAPKRPVDSLWGRITGMAPLALGQ